MSETPVVFFGAGPHALMFFEGLARQYSPVAFGDNDTKKQGTCFLGLPVLSLGEIEVRYPGCRFLVTVNDLTKPFVVTSLIDAGVAPSRIINYVEYKRYRSCIYLETQLRYNKSQMQFCCSDFGKNISPCIAKGTFTHEEHLNAFFDMRDRTIDELNELNRLDSNVVAPNPCVDCHNIRNIFWQHDRRIRHINLNFCSVCNFKCSYCTVIHDKRDKNNDTFNDSVEDVLSLLRLLKHKKIINVDTVIHIAAGEIAVHPTREKIKEMLTELLDYTCFIYTNGSVYNETIGKVLSNRKSKIIVSIDAGTRETFAKIKGVDLYDKVCENLSKYSADGTVQLKYIVLPNINDNEADMLGFVDLCSRLNIRAVDISRDSNTLNPFADDTINLIVAMMLELQKQGINPSISNDAFLGMPEDMKRIEERLAKLVKEHCPALLPLKGGHSV